MILEFSWLPPEINSARIYGGSGSGPLFTAAAAWETLAADLQASASSFQSVLTGLASGPWSGGASASMSAAATPYVGWLSAAAGQAQLSAGQARAAATVFEGALAAAVHPAVVTANRTSLLSLVETNFLGQNTGLIAATEFDYMEMWAQDVAAMAGYHSGAMSVASALMPFAVPPVGLAGLAAQVGAQASGIATVASAEVAPVLQGAAVALPSAVTQVQSVVSTLPVSSLTSLARMGMYPASMMMSQMMSLANRSAQPATAGAAAAGLASADVPKLAGASVAGMKGLGSGALGAATSSGLGKARLMGALSVPPSWEGSTPTQMASSAMSGLGGARMPNPAEMGQAAGTGGMRMMPMPMGAGGAGAGMPGGMMSRGGGSPNMPQSRPSVVPRIGV